MLNVGITDTKVQNGEKWIKVEAVVDSGTVATLSPPGIISEEDLKQTEWSKKGVGWTAADGGKIRNMGEGAIEAVSEEGINVDMTAQVGDKVGKILLAASKMAEAGNAVLLNVDRELIKRLARETEIHENMIVNKGSLVKSKVYNKGGLYVYPMWIKQKGKKKDDKSEEVKSGAKYFTANMVDEQDGDNQFNPWVDLF